MSIRAWTEALRAGSRWRLQGGELWPRGTQSPVHPSRPGETDKLATSWPETLCIPSSHPREGWAQSNPKYVYVGNDPVMKACMAITGPRQVIWQHHGSTRKILLDSLLPGLEHTPCQHQAVQQDQTEKEQKQPEERVAQQLRHTNKLMQVPGKQQAGGTMVWGDKTLGEL
ncbi:hypothetical protein Y1Q_0015251 [Alligator mississippiensis]|uniref:Uncharacterized protein n=1 Tax=Alligator mississippiensis TaxID=8496 RepID=A0A151NL40_ALLMI|nr:hypothetical protein Y1Q_0015251 [Alligator mississippiensis]